MHLFHRENKSHGSSPLSLTSCRWILKLLSPLLSRCSRQGGTYATHLQRGDWVTQTVAILSSVLHSMSQQGITKVDATCKSREGPGGNQLNLLESKKKLSALPLPTHHCLTGSSQWNRCTSTRPHAYQMPVPSATSRLKLMLLLLHTLFIDLPCHVWLFSAW